MASKKTNKSKNNKQHPNKTTSTNEDVSIIETNEPVVDSNEFVNNNELETTDISNIDSTDIDNKDVVEVVEDNLTAELPIAVESTQTVVQSGTKGKKKNKSKNSNLHNVQLPKGDELKEIIHDTLENNEIDELIRDNSLDEGSIPDELSTNIELDTTIDTIKPATPRIVKNIKNKKKKQLPISEVKRVEPDLENGLDFDIIDLRKEEGYTNYKHKTTSKSLKSIFFSNIFTFFNILTLSIAGWLISVGAIKDLTFLVIVAANIIIGIIQEIRAKKTIDNLSLLSSPTASVIRSGSQTTIPVDEVVLDELILFETGKQICADSIVLDGNVEVNESLLTGESDAIQKKPGDTLMSGSYIVSGNCKAKVVAVGKDNYVDKLTNQAKKYKKPKSELLGTLNIIIWVMAAIIIPIGALLFYLQISSGNVEYVNAVRKTAGAMIGMIPSGLYLLTSIALAVGVIKLAKNNVLVQELYCIEMLARVNVLCLDKTGTITDGTMTVKNIIEYNSINGLSTKNIVSAMLNATNDSNMTNNALEEKFGRAKRIKNLEIIPFSSQRKFSAV
ncbi:MAG: HAD-IC family P-type ATPase, partial [Anaeroplasmataceae bacterium]